MGIAAQPLPGNRMRRALPLLSPLLALIMMTVATAHMAPSAFVTPPPHHCSSRALPSTQLYNPRPAAHNYGVKLQAAAGRQQQGAPPRLNYRRGEPSDQSAILRAMMSERMNPLALDPRRFLCVEQPDGDGSMQLVGFGQVRPLPGGGPAFELASVYVSPEGRGKGIGSQLVSRLVSEFREEQGKEAPLFLLTLRPRASFYQPAGFVEVDVSETPKVMQVEYSLGKIVTRLSGRGGNALICMRLAA